ncbi:MAG: GNAT family N-acetyltransferase, partial [Pontibacterium sp.]
MPPISLPHDIRFHQLSAEDLPTLRRFYRQHGHKGKPASHEVCYALSHTDCKIVAGIRFRPYQPDHLLFRGLWVAKDKRYQGLGKTLLNLSIEAIG